LEAIFASLECGAVLVTATRRLARVFRQDYAAWQRDRGRSVWKSPLILPLDAYVRRLWSEWLARATEDVLLLSSDQEALVWARIISDSPEGASLLQIDATARRAMEAWSLMQAYRLPLDSRFQATEDCAAFASWAHEFERRSTEHHWLDGARLAAFVLERLRAGEIARPTAAWFAGFDEISPQQREFLTEIAAQPCQPPPLRTTTRTKLCATAEDEIRCAAAWARGILEEHPAARIGIVVLNLTQLRSKVERIFRDVLQPGAAPEAEPAFHISLGRPLAHYPIVHAALLILEFACGPLPLAKAGMLLRSPYLGGARDEQIARASLDAYLRRTPRSEISLDELRKQAHAKCPLLNRSLWAMQDVLTKRSGLQSHTELSRIFSELVRAIGWPGDRPLDTHEHQLLGRWTELLSELAAMDAVSSPLSLVQAFERLRALASGAIFQFEDTGAPIQISDHVEIAGVRFDHLWVMGLHDEVLPAAANPNPFLPITMQWERSLPNSSAELQHEFARIVFERLSSSAPNVVLSFPKMEADRALSPSPLLTAIPQPAAAQPSAWIEAIRASAKLETFVDELGPPHTGEGIQLGGVSLLRDMAACPFRAFANHRLGARELEKIEPGLSPSQKGTILHDVLKLIWSELRSHTRLCELAAEDLAELIRRNVAIVLDRFGDNTSIRVERIRLERLLTKWIELERRRPPFTVLSVEEQKTIEIGSLQLQIKADRIDELPDDRRVILDYKTGEVKSQSWTGPRPDQPQVPLYCISSDAPIAAAAFARIQAEGVGFSGLAATPLPDFHSYAGRNDPPFEEQIAEWRRSLTALADQFRAGDARVDPKQPGKTCEYCAIVPLCRIREYGDDD
jgi:probable DNA repair protein